MSDQNSSTKGSFIEEEHKTSLLIASFSVISVTIGAGMVSVPKAAYDSGIIWSLFYNVLNWVF